MPTMPALTGQPNRVLEAPEAASLDGPNRSCASIGARPYYSNPGRFGAFFTAGHTHPWTKPQTPATGLLRGSRRHCGGVVCLASSSHESEESMAGLPPVFWRQRLHTCQGIKRGSACASLNSTAFGKLAMPSRFALLSRDQAPCPGIQPAPRSRQALEAQACIKRCRRA